MINGDMLITSSSVTEMTVLFIMVTRAGDVYADEKPMIMDPMETATAARTWKLRTIPLKYNNKHNSLIQNCCCMINKSRGNAFF